MSLEEDERLNEKKDRLDKRTHLISKKNEKKRREFFWGPQKTPKG
jgi:hypothetical protein